jgi:arylsulfatase A-like enzyme
MPAAAIRSGDWKLVLHYENQKTELYNLKNDLSEEIDLSLENPAKAKELYRKLYEWLEETKANLPISKSTGQPIILRSRLD